MSPRMYLELVEAREDVDRRKDCRAGVIASVIANVHRDGAKQPTAFQPADFFSSLDVEQTEEDHEALWDSLVDGPPVEAASTNSDRLIDLD